MRRSCLRGTTPLPAFPGDPRAIASLKATSRQGSAFKVCFGPIASGDEDIVERARGQDLHRLTGALAVAWEGAGGARAARFSEVGFLEIRGVTDAADHKAPSEFYVYLREAMYAVSDVVTDWAASLSVSA